VTLTPHPLLVPRSIKQNRAIRLLSLRAFVACKKGETYLLEPTTHKVYFLSVKKISELISVADIRGVS
jgi:hypothetical protein